MDVVHVYVKVDRVCVYMLMCDMYLFLVFIIIDKTHTVPSVLLAVLYLTYCTMWQIYMYNMPDDSV